MILSPWKKSYDQPRQHIKRQRHYFANKGPSSQSCGFSNSNVLDVRVGTGKKAECRRIDAFELWWWRELLRVPWTAKRSNQSILKEIDSECPLEGLMLTLKLQYTLAIWWEELTHWKITWSWDRLRARGEWSSRRWKHYIASLTQWIHFWGNSGR